MAHKVLRDKVKCIQNSMYFGIMANEYTDIANSEQVSSCLRWLDHDKIQVYEDFVGFYVVNNIKSETIVAAIKDALLRFQLPILSVMVKHAMPLLTG